MTSFSLSTFSPSLIYVSGWQLMTSQGLVLCTKLRHSTSVRHPPVPFEEN